MGVKGDEEVKKDNG